MLSRDPEAKLLGVENDEALDAGCMHVTDCTRIFAWLTVTFIIESAVILHNKGTEGILCPAYPSHVTLILLLLSGAEEEQYMITDNSILQSEITVNPDQVSYKPPAKSAHRP